MLDFVGKNVIELYNSSPDKAHHHTDVIERIMEKDGMEREELEGKNPCEEEDLGNILYGVYKHFWHFLNNIQGTLPPELGILKSLKSILFMYPSDFGGTIPSQIGTLTNLTALAFAFAGHGRQTMVNIGGPLPSEIGSLSQLQFLHVLANELTGSLPTETGQLSELLLL